MHRQNHIVITNYIGLYIALHGKNTTFSYNVVSDDDDDADDG